MTCLKGAECLGETEKEANDALVADFAESRRVAKAPSALTQRPMIWGTEQCPTVPDTLQ